MIKDKEYYEGLDKRTKEYQTYAKFHKLGNGTKEIRFKGVSEDKPKEILRPFHKVHFQVYGMYRDSRTLNVWNENDIDLLISLYAHAFAIQYNSKDLTKENKGAFKRLTKMSKELDIVYETYKRDLSDLKTK